MDSLGILIGSAGTSALLESRTTCNAPTTTVALMKAESTPTAKAIPNVSSGGNGEIMFARKAATVVITAKPEVSTILHKRLTKPQQNHLILLERIVPPLKVY